MKWLYPKKYVKTVFDIDYEALRSQGYRAIFFDIDNTLAAFDEAIPSEAIMDLLGQLKQHGFKLALISNNSVSRVTTFNHKLDVKAYANAGKPFVGTLKKALHFLEVTPKETIFVGDQLFTDVWAGNALQLYTVLVKPIQEKEQCITRIKRGLEGVFLNHYIKKQGLERFK